MTGRPTCVNILFHNLDDRGNQMRALEGIKVLDLTRALAGPFCTLMLGDYGADVIKIEIPNTGDDTRHWGPPFIGEESAYFLSINRNKRSLTLNFKEKEARNIFLKLASTADVIVENFTPGVMERFGLSYEEVKKVNKNIVYCSISGFGQTGPYRERPAMDQIMQGVSGLMSITGEPDGDPQKIGIAVTDIGSGMWAAYAVMSAIYYREKHGEGQHLDVSMLDSQVAWLTYQAATYFATGESPKRLGAAHPNLVPYQGFMCKDAKFINIAVGSERIWERFCQAINLPDLKDNPEYAVNEVRVKNRSKIIPMLQQHFLTRTLNEWLTDLQAGSVPSGPINDLEAVFNDPQVIAREMLTTMTHPTAGEIKQTGLSIKFSESPGELRLAPPLLGQHNEEILSEIGYSDSEIEKLKSDSII